MPIGECSGNQSPLNPPNKLMKGGNVPKRSTEAILGELLQLLLRLQLWLALRQPLHDGSDGRETRILESSYVQAHLSIPGVPRAQVTSGETLASLDFGVTGDHPRRARGSICRQVLCGRLPFSEPKVVESCPHGLSEASVPFPLPTSLSLPRQSAFTAE